MPVPVHSPPEAHDGHEPCCFCERPTTSWTCLGGRSDGAQVACCPSCAAERNPLDVPTKADWFIKHRKR